MRKKPVWYDDYLRSTNDTGLIFSHFLKDFLFQHRLRYMICFRIAQTAHNPLLRFFCRYRLFRMSRKFGIEIHPATKIGPGFVMTHPYNITISPQSVIGKNVSVLKGATIGHSQGKHPGAPILGDRVYVGLNATVLGGITVGDDVLIAPNTFVNQDIPSHSIVIGNPCTVIPREGATRQYIYNCI